MLILMKRASRAVMEMLRGPGPSRRRRTCENTDVPREGDPIQADIPGPMQS